MFFFQFACSFNYINTNLRCLNLRQGWSCVEDNIAVLAPAGGVTLTLQSIFANLYESWSSQMDPVHRKCRNAWYIRTKNNILYRITQNVTVMLCFKIKVYVQTWLVCTCRWALKLKCSPVCFHVCICSGCGLIVNNWMWMNVTSCLWLSGRVLWSRLFSRAEWFSMRAFCVPLNSQDNPRCHYHVEVIKITEQRRWQRQAVGDISRLGKKPKHTTFDNHLSMHHYGWVHLKLSLAFWLLVWPPCSALSVKLKAAACTPSAENEPRSPFNS